MADETFESVMEERRQAALKAAGGEQPQPAGPGVVGTAADVAKGFGSGVERGVVGTPGLPGDIAHAMITLQNWMRRKLGPEGLNVPGVQGQPLSQEGSEFIPPTSQGVIQGATNLGLPGVDYEPTTGAGKVAQVAGEFAPAAVLPGQLAIRGATGGARVVRGASDLALQAAAPAVAATGAEHLAQGTPLEPYAGPAAAVATSLATGRITPPRAATPLPGYQPGAVERVNRAIVDEGGHAAVARQLGDVGDEARLMDIGNLRQQAEALVSMPGAAQPMLLDAARQRHQAAGDRISAAIDRTMGPPDDFTARTQQLIEDRRRTANDLYAQARSAGPGAMNVDTTSVIDHIARQIPESVLTDASRATGIETTLLGISERLANRRDVASLHNLKESIDDQIGAALRSGQNTTAYKLRDVQGELVGALDRATETAPGQSLYRQARQQYAGDSAVLNARDAGASVFNRDVRPADLRRDLAQMSDAERENFRQAGREQVEILMDNARNDAQAVRAHFEKGGNQDKLRILLGNDQANDLLRVLEGETRKAGTYQRLTGQSATAGRTAAQQEFPSTVETLRPTERPTPGQLLVHAGLGLANAVREPWVLGRRAAVNRDVARILTAPPAGQGQLLQQLQQAYGQAGRTPGFAVQGPLAARSATLDERDVPSITVTPRR